MNNQPSTTSAKIGIGPEWWASQIAVCFAKSARAVIETGRRLNEAEAALSRAAVSHLRLGLRIELVLFPP